MMIQFSVENFISIKDRVFLNMNATRFKEHSCNISFIENHKLNLLKSACIYGPNASGKSNLVQAMSFFTEFILNSTRTQVGGGISGVSNFKFNTDTEKKPSSFEMDFLIEGVIYRYGFEVDTTRIHKEWLFAVINKKEVKLFERHGKEIETTSYFKEGKDLKDKTRENALFLSVVAQFNGEMAVKIIKWFKNFIILSGDVQDKRSVDGVMRGNLKASLMHFLHAADLGIDDIEVKEKDLTFDDLPKHLPEEVRKMIMNHPENTKIVEKYSKHKKYNSENAFVSFESLPFDAESKGTGKIFNMFGYLYDALANGMPIIVDELESSLHPMIVEWILNLFNSSDNKNGAQLIFTTHDINVLDKKYFRRDQIWFIEKDKYGTSRLFSLSEYGSKVRNDASFAKDYMFGKYGAIPVIKKFRISQQKRI